MKSDTRVVASGNRWRRRLIVLFLVVGVVYVNLNDQHKVRNWLALFAIGLTLTITNSFWHRHLLRKQGIDPDADEIAEARETVRDVIRNGPKAKRSRAS